MFAIRHTGKTLILALLSLALLCGGAMAANTLSYQGVLRDPAGAAVADGTYAMDFSLWDAETIGNQLWSEAHGAVTTKDGAFSVVLGATTALGTIFTDHSALWLQIAVNTGSGLEIYAPRVPMTAAPYAQQAQNADTLDGLNAADFLGVSHNTTPSAHGNIALDGARITSGKIDNARLNTGADNGLDSDTVDGKHASELDDTAEITTAINNHNNDTMAHPLINLNAARITAGKLDNARLNTGTGGGIDADSVDGSHATDFAATVHTHNLQDLGGAVTPAQTPNLQDLNGAVTDAQVPDLQNLSGTVTDAQVPNDITINYAATAGTAASATNATNATNADTLDGSHAAAFALLSHTHSASAITSGQLDIARIPTGTTNTTVALGDHTHASTVYYSGPVGIVNGAGAWKTFPADASYPVISSGITLNGARTQLIVPVAGRYYIHFQQLVQTPAGNANYIHLYHNGNVRNCAYNPAGSFHDMVIDRILDMAAGDYISFLNEGTQSNSWDARHSNITIYLIK